MKINLSNQKRKKQLTQAPLQNILYWQMFILFATLVFYFPSFSLEFVNWDDVIYMFKNPFIHSLSVSNIGDIFSGFFNGNYHPLTMLTYAIENSIAGESPFIYHFTNVLFHLANTYLVFIFVQKLIRLIRKDNNNNTGLLIAVISSLLFGLHPFHVESVSWISQRKDVLYTFFFILALITYLRYIEKPKLNGYLITLFLFALSLFSKGMAVSFSVTVVAIDYVLKRDLLSKKVFVEKIPFFFLSVIFGFIAIKAQKAEEAMALGDAFTFLEKLAFSSYGLSQYFIKLFIPFNLSHYYPYPAFIKGAIPSFYYLFPVLIVSGLVVLFKFFRKSRVVMFGFMFFLINIFLVLKFIPVGEVIMADRYTYLSSIGIFLVIALFFEYLFTQKAQFKGIIVFVLVVYVLFLGIQTHQRTKVWKTTYTLWNDANSKSPKNATILLNRALGHLMNGKTELAMKDYKNCLKLDPYYYEAYTNLGNIEQERGNYKQSIVLYTKGLAIQVNNEKAYCKRGQSFLNIGRFDEAITDLNMAIKLNPSYTEAYKNRGAAKMMKGDYYEAIKDFNSLIKYDPNYAEAYYGRGLCYINTNNKEQGCIDLYKASELKFEVPQTLINNSCR